MPNTEKPNRKKFTTVVRGSEIWLEVQSIDTKTHKPRPEIPAPTPVIMMDILKRLPISSVEVIPTGDPKIFPEIPGLPTKPPPRPPRETDVSS